MPEHSMASQGLFQHRLIEINQHDSEQSIDFQQP